MKIKFLKSILLLAILSLFGCGTQKEYITVEQDTPIFSNKSANDNPLIVIPANTKVYILKSKRKYERITYGIYEGWRFNPKWHSGKTSDKAANPQSRKSSERTYSSDKTVNVKGYTRKDGTYVRPHTRSAPHRR